MFNFSCEIGCHFLQFGTLWLIQLTDSWKPVQLLHELTFVTTVERISPLVQFTGWVTTLFFFSQYFHFVRCSFLLWYGLSPEDIFSFHFYKLFLETTVKNIQYNVVHIILEWNYVQTDLLTKVTELQQILPFCLSEKMCNAYLDIFLLFCWTK